MTLRRLSARRARVLRTVFAVAAACVTFGACRDDHGRSHAVAETAKGTIDSIRQEGTAVVYLFVSGQKVTISPAAQVVDATGHILSRDDVFPGFTISATGFRTDVHGLVAERVSVDRAPPIVVTSPREGAIIRSFPVVIGGYARVFENVLFYRVRATSRPDLLGEGRVVAKSPDIGRYGPFEATFTPERAAVDSGDLVIEVFTHSPRDGAEADAVLRTVNLHLAETATLWFGNSVRDPEMRDCARVFPVRRRIGTESPPDSVLALLLHGPTVEERSRGFFTSIPRGTTLRGVTISGRTARADFTFPQVGGSCLVTAIRAEITETLRDNYGVTEVVILDDGDAEEALQP